jgi:hypothetical protein
MTGYAAVLAAFVVVMVVLGAIAWWDLRHQPDEETLAERDRAAAEYARRQALVDAALMDGLRAATAERNRRPL